MERDILDCGQTIHYSRMHVIEMTESGFMDMTPSFCKFRKSLEEEWDSLCDR